MSDILQHYGILGMKWGVRRTPEELGHNPHESNEAKRSGEPGASTKKIPGKSDKRYSVMSDEELRQRINRLEMEERYENLVARQNARNTGKVRKLLGEAVENFGRKAMGTALDKALNKMFDGDGKFDIDRWKNEDVDKMDMDTIGMVAKYYKQAESITSSRKKIADAEVENRLEPLFDDDYIKGLLKG